MKDEEGVHPNRTDTALSHLTESELAGYLDQDLSMAERRDVEDHLDACDLCRAELVAAVRLLDRDQSVKAPAAMEQKRSRRWSIPVGIAGLAAAAALAAVLLVSPEAPFSHRVAPEQERFNTDGVGRLLIHGPPDEELVARDDLRFVWADHGTGSYRITIMAEAGGLIWSSAVADTVVEPPPSLELDSGERFFWFVDAISGGVVARTEPHSFMVAP
jgi:hypothetical protein